MPAETKRSRRSPRTRPNLRLLITAGPTREYIDSVRYISNESSGRMGLALAAEAVSRGHAVTLIHGSIAFPIPKGVRAIAIVSAADMLRACRREWPRQDALIMAAAVADYTPRRTSRIKLKKKAESLRLDLKPTTDILAALSKARRNDQIVIGFALEDRDGRRNAESKLQRKNLDAIVLNRPAALSATHAAQEILVRGEGWQSVPRSRKDQLAKRLMGVLDRLAAIRPGSKG